MSDASSSDHRLANGRFAKGNPGGPGRPRTADRIVEFDQRVAEAGPELINALLEVAKAGNPKAIGMLLDRIWPVRRGRPVAVDAPEIRSVADLRPTAEAVTSAVFSGELTPQEGSDAARVLMAHSNMLELVDFERRLTELEKESAKARQR
jgi:hypothetical protein